MTAKVLPVVFSPVSKLTARLNGAGSVAVTLPLEAGSAVNCTAFFDCELRVRFAAGIATNTLPAVAIPAAADVSCIGAARSRYHRVFAGYQYITNRAVAEIPNI